MSSQLKRKGNRRYLLYLRKQQIMKKLKASAKWNLYSDFDNEYLSGEKLYKFYNYRIWNKRFADVISMDDAMKSHGYLV